MTLLIRWSAFSRVVARLRTVCACGSVATAPWLTWTTTCSAVEFRPAISWPRIVRAWADGLPLSCPPAADSFFST